MKMSGEIGLLALAIGCLLLSVGYNVFVSVVGRLSPWFFAAASGARG